VLERSWIPKNSILILIRIITINLKFSIGEGIFCRMIFHFNNLALLGVQNEHLLASLYFSSLKGVHFEHPFSKMAR
jgi:hypothetical protein